MVNFVTSLFYLNGLFFDFVAILNWILSTNQLDFHLVMIFMYRLAWLLPDKHTILVYLIVEAPSNPPLNPPLTTPHKTQTVKQTNKQIQ